MLRSVCFNVDSTWQGIEPALHLRVKPGSQYDAGASVASRTSRASSAKTGVPVHNLASVAS